MENVKRLIGLLLLIAVIGNAQVKQQSKEEIYVQNCMKCHKQMSLTMQKIFMRYLLKYSSEVSVKSALYDFLKNPNYFTSALRKDQIARYGLKGKTTLTDTQLRKAIDTYWEKYKIFGKLK